MGIEGRVGVCLTGNMASDSKGATVAKMPIIQCVVCEYLTLLPPEGVTFAPVDDEIVPLPTKYGEGGQLLCNSCDNGDNAVAKCQDCATHLCSECLDAHKEMSCFQSHQVIITVIISYLDTLVIVRW